MDMARLSEQAVFTSIKSYDKGTSVKKQIFEWSERLQVLQDEKVGRAAGQILGGSDLVNAKRKAE